MNRKQRRERVKSIRESQRKRYLDHRAIEESRYTSGQQLNIPKWEGRIKESLAARGKLENIVEHSSAWPRWIGVAASIVSLASLVSCAGRERGKITDYVILPDGNIAVVYDWGGNADPYMWKDGELTSRIGETQQRDLFIACGPNGALLVNGMYDGYGPNGKNVATTVTFPPGGGTPSQAQPTTTNTSWQQGRKVTVDEGRVYINDILVQNSRSDEEPALSLDGLLLVTSSKNENGVPQLYAQPTDGSTAPTPIPNTQYCQNPHFVSSGKYYQGSIVTARVVNNTYSLVLLNPRGKIHREVDFGNDHVANPQVGPDGTFYFLFKGWLYPTTIKELFIDRIIP